eukprot:Amastigsp_a679100_6.p1 type:complete len:128 gc:universal Amastigsp_a679100_6:439-56(-)
MGCVWRDPRVGGLFAMFALMAAVTNVARMKPYAQRRHSNMDTVGCGAAAAVVAGGIMQDWRLRAVLVVGGMLVGFAVVLYGVGLDIIISMRRRRGASGELVNLESEDDDDQTNDIGRTDEHELKSFK